VERKASSVEIYDIYLGVAEEHSSASLLINMGFSLKEVQEWLGHANIASTNIYSHLLYKSKENMAEKVNEALSLG